MESTTDRHIGFEGSFNFRDLGGYRTEDGRTVRWRRVFRADSVHLMSEGDAARVRDELKVRTLLDLRSTLEAQGRDLGPLKADGIAYHHLPFTDAGRQRGREVAGAGTGVESSAGSVARDADRSPSTMASRYLEIMERSTARVTGAVERLADPDAQPAVFFCSAGKDRTGVLAAVVLGAIGVSDEDIAADYELTARFIEPIIRRLGSRGPSMYRDHPPEHFAPQAETMQILLDQVRERYGSMRGYLSANGVDDTTVQRLETTLLTDG